MAGIAGAGTGIDGITGTTPGGRAAVVCGTGTGAAVVTAGTALVTTGAAVVTTGTAGITGMVVCGATGTGVCGAGVCGAGVCGAAVVSGGIGTTPGGNGIGVVDFCTGIGTNMPGGA